MGANWSLWMRSYNIQNQFDIIFQETESFQTNESSPTARKVRLLRKIYSKLSGTIYLKNPILFHNHNLLKHDRYVNYLHVSHQLDQKLFFTPDIKSETGNKLPTSTD